MSLLRCGTHVGPPRRDAADLQYCLLSHGWTCFQEWSLAYWSSRRTPSVQSPHEHVSHRWPHLLGPMTPSSLLSKFSESTEVTRCRASRTQTAPKSSLQTASMYPSTECQNTIDIVLKTMQPARRSTNFKVSAHSLPAWRVPFIARRSRQQNPSFTR